MCLVVAERNICTLQSGPCAVHACEFRLSAYAFPSGVPHSETSSEAWREDCQLANYMGGSPDGGITWGMGNPARNVGERDSEAYRKFVQRMQ